MLKLLLIAISFQLYCNHAVTYILGGGRLGDNLMGYMHAKWISYRYNLPLLYKLFPLSDQFALDDLEERWTPEIERRYRNFLNFRYGHNIDSFIKFNYSTDDVLYSIPYFPESEWELKGTTNGVPNYPYFQVDWKDPGFLALLRKFIAPKVPIKRMNLPTDKTTVAVHLRKGGSHDDDQTYLLLPLKFPPDDFYVEQLRSLYYLLGNKPLYVFLFTDDESPIAIKRTYEEKFKDLDIEFDCREEGNRWNANVIEDFFALTQFDCAIHGESNFSVCAGILADYQAEIVPKRFHFVDRKLVIDDVVIHVKSKRN